MGTRKRPLDIPTLTTEQIARFWSRVDKQGGTGCWLWRGTFQHTGYGEVSLFDRSYAAHRVALALSGVTLDPELVCDHACRNRACVNPQHLEQVSNSENVLLGIGLGAMNARKALCVKGHLLTPRKQGRGRECRLCLRQKKKHRGAKAKRPCPVCRERMTANERCRPCGMRAAWARPDYGERSRAERSGRRRRCLHCGEQGLSREAKYHAPCWRSVLAAARDRGAQMA